MDGLIYAFVATLLAGMGARDQVLVAVLTDKLGRRGTLLTLACLTGAIASIFAAWATREVAAQLTYPARMVLACFALAAGGLESILIGPRRRAREPTRSLFAAALVLLMDQMADASRFLVLAIALATDPVAAAIGGTLGNAASLLVGWLGAGPLLGLEGGLRTGRRFAGTLLLLAAIGFTVFVWVVFAPH